MNLGAHSRDRGFSKPVSSEPNRESDFFNLSLPQVRRNKDGGFGAAARVEPFTTSGGPWAPSRTVNELQERQAMTQTLEPGIKSEHSKGKRTSGDGAQTTNAEQRSLGDRRAHNQVGYGIAIQRVVG